LTRVATQAPPSTGLASAKQSIHEGPVSSFVSSDDGARLYSDGEPVVDNDFVHPLTMAFTTLTLRRGYHDLRLDYFENTAAAGIQLAWDPTGGMAVTPIPAANLVQADAGAADRGRMSDLLVIRSSA